MTLTVTKKETQEIEITFPLYKKLGNKFYKGISEKEWIQLMPNISCVMVYDSPYQLDEVLMEGKDIAPEQFNQVFSEVFNKIKNYQP